MDLHIKTLCEFDKMVPIDQIKPNERNPNEHSERQIEIVAKIIQDQGWRHPLIVSNLSGKLVVGHCRLEAAKKLGLSEIPVDFQDFSSEQEEMKFMIADNKSASLASHNDALMIENIKDLNLESMDFELLGLPDFDLPLEADPAKEEIEDEVPENVETRVKLGDIWKLGNHRLMCGDSTSIDAVEKLMDGQKADMVFTDPPYNIAYGSSKNPKWGSKWNGRNNDGAIKNDNMSREDFEKFCKDWAGTLAAVCDGCLYVWGPPGADGRIMFTVLDSIFHDSTTIIWNKDRMTLGRGKYQNKYEPCWFGWNVDGTGFVCTDRSITNVWDFKRPSSNDLHPTMKPIELVSYGIEHASRSGGAVLDIFGGSGSTLIACEKTNRKCFMMELDPHYCSVILARWEKYSGKTAERITGEN